MVGPGLPGEPELPVGLAAPPDPPDPPAVPPALVIEGPKDEALLVPPTVTEMGVPAVIVAPGLAVRRPPAPPAPPSPPEAPEASPFNSTMDQAAADDAPAGPEQLE